MKKGRNPRTGRRLDHTTCCACGDTFPGRVLPADKAYCPRCESKLDPEPNQAKFAPGRRGGIVSEEPEDDG